MIKVYTYSHNRPDLIEPQYDSLKKHIKDDFEYIVFNNERQGGDPGSGYDPERITEINSVCNRLGIQCIRVELDPDLQYINGYKQFEGESFVSGGGGNIILHTMIVYPLFLILICSSLGIYLFKIL